MRDRSRSIFLTLSTAVTLAAIPGFTCAEGIAAKTQTVDCESAATPFASTGDWTNKYFAQHDSLADATTSQLRLLKNEIFARKGYIFKSPELIDYFSKQAWYHPNREFSERLFSDKERDSLARVLMFEKIIRLNPVDKSGEGMISKTVSMDLDGSGKKRMWVSWNPARESESILHIDDSSATLYGTAYIVELDTKDKVKEIAASLMEEGGGTTDFYIYRGSRLIKIGQTPGLIEGDLILYGDGRIKSPTANSGFLFTWTHPQDYRLDENRRIVRVNKPMYAMNLKVRVRDRLSLQKSPQDSSLAAEILPGQELTFLASDNAEWVEAESTACVKGWFAVDAPDTIRGTHKSADQIFDGLVRAN